MTQEGGTTGTLWFLVLGFAGNPVYPNNILPKFSGPDGGSFWIAWMDPLVNVYISMDRSNIFMGQLTKFL